MITEAVCTAVIPSTPAPGGVLASTGIDLAPLLFLSVLVIVAGVTVVLMRRRRTRGLLLLSGLAIAGLLAVPAGPAFAGDTSTGSCALIRIDDINQGDASNLLPGQNPVPVLAYTVTNVTAFTIDVTVSTDVTSDPAEAAGLVTTIISHPAGPTTASLAAAPFTSPLRLGPGQTGQYQYQVALTGDAGNAAQDVSMTFDSIITANQR